MTNEPTAIHPGKYVREKILKPRQVNVTEAAKLIGISRPGVSGFLNGKVSATPDMAARLERAFGVSAKTILDMQSDFDSTSRKKAESAENARPYVAPFLNVKANEISNWFASSISARTKFAVLLRILVHSTGYDLRKVDFPGNDDAERPGWDGIVEASTGTPWIPSGLSGWEFGVTAKINAKADGDFAKSVTSMTKEERSSIVFVFVTPRRWPGKAEWIAEAKAKDQWKDVRAYDVSDLEQWMAQSLAAQTWFANETDRQSNGVRTLDRCWTDWANVTTPKLHPSLFDTAVQAWTDKVKQFLVSNEFRPMVIAADSVEEALAFLSIIMTEPGLNIYRDRALVFDQTGVLPRLAHGTTDFIAVAYNRQVEREFGPYSASLRTIVIYPRNAANSDPDIELEPLSYEAFNSALEAMGKDRDEIALLANKSGRSLTVLRRQLSLVPAIRTPIWAEEHEKSSSLIPLVLIGAWDAQNEADRILLSLLDSDTPFQSLERRVLELAKLNDTPVWSIGRYRGVISKIDCLFAIAAHFTRDDLDRFLTAARIVLSEDDPALDLPEEDRWTAAIHGKKREFSGAVRDGVSETLVLLAVHGKTLFGSNLGFDGETAAAQLVRDILEPLSPRKLEANNRDLPLFAEAAPTAFLEIVERDLRSSDPHILRILRPVDTSMFGSSSPRTGLLWALEGLAWNPETFARVVNILGRLSEVEINDNLANKPISSLNSIFRSWIPQTAADHETRLKAIKMLLDKYPSVGWRICLNQFGSYEDSFGTYSHKPKWRTDGYGYGEPFDSWHPVQAFVKETIALSLKRPSYSVEMICDLIGKLHALNPEYQETVWQIIGRWHRSGPDDADIAQVREKIRVTALTKRSRRKASKNLQVTLPKVAQAIYDALKPADIIFEYEWLFRETWIDESAEELSGDETDYREREERLHKKRIFALREILKSVGMDGVITLAARGNTRYLIGALLAKELLEDEEIYELVIRCLTSSNEHIVRQAVASGAITAIDDGKRAHLYRLLKAQFNNEQALLFLQLSPYCRATWEHLDQLPLSIQSKYWRSIIPQYVFNSPDENNESVRRLLEFNRPRAAFAAVHFGLKKIRPQLLVQMLSTMLLNEEDDRERYPLRDYEIRRAFQILDNSPNIDFEEKVRLEFAYLEVLARSFGDRDERQIPNLERYIEQHPEMFIQAVVWAYKRQDGGKDPAEYEIKENSARMAVKSYKLLDSLARIPGSDEYTISAKRARLSDWLSAVRLGCARLGRAAVADICIGNLLSHSPSGADDVWPNEVIRDVMEEIQSEEISRGARTGLYNSRGVHWRGEGGAQERELSEKYRRWANALQFTHPFVSSFLLMSMVRTYEHEAEQEDIDAGVRRRMSY